MPAPKHAAFLDLEESLAGRLRNAWAHYWAEQSKAIVQLTAQGKFDQAHQLAEAIDLGPLFERARPHVRTIGMAALLLGASRVRGKVKHSSVAKFPPKRQLDTFIEQLHIMLARNASQALRDMAHAWVAEEEQSTLLKTETSSLYVSRPVLNADEIIAWAKSQGFETTVPPEQLHVTVAYSRKSVDWAAWQPMIGQLAITGAVRKVMPLGGDGAVVLKFESTELQTRWRKFIDGGCSWDYEGYQPHTTLTYEGAGDLDLTKVKPYQGQILLGPETFEPLSDDLTQTVVEKYDPNQPRDWRGRWTKDFSLAVEQRGELLFNHIVVDGGRVGHISGAVVGGGFRIYRTQVDPPLRGTGLYRQAVQLLANRYPEGAFTFADESSPQLQASLKKMPTYRWGEVEGRNALRVLPTIEKFDPDQPRAPKGSPEGGQWVTDPTSTPEFKAWFGDSKVVDAAGKPLVVYHGTGANIDVFDSSRATLPDTNKEGVAWFSEAPEVAGYFAGSQVGESVAGVQLGHSNILPVYLSLQNPYIDKRGEYAKSGGLTRAQAAELIAEGYDGIIWPESPYDLPDTTDQGPVTGYYRNRHGQVFGNDVPYPSQYAVFSPAQIKSVFNPRPTSDPHLLKAEVAKRERPNLQVRINVAGRNFFALAASVQVSRLTAFGFLAEAAEAGVKNYRIDAVLDTRTCEVCKHMDGWVFPVESGLALAAQIMETQDPDALKQLAPFYAQNKASLAELPSYTTEDFIGGGMALPPFHPLCRCILVPTTEAADVHPTDQADRVALASQALYGDGDGAELTRRLFGVDPPDPADALQDPTSDEGVGPWLDRLSEPPAAPAAPPEPRPWSEVVMDRLTEQANVQPDALTPPEVFGGDTIPRNWVLPFDPKQLASLAASRWPWLAGILGWLALREKRPVPVTPVEPEDDFDEDDEEDEDNP